MDVSKYPDPLPESEKNCVLQAKNNVLFSSTTVSNGQGIGVVIGTGMNTEIGEIQA
jgi:Ca2+-transporting ATPase